MPELDYIKEIELLTYLLKQIEAIENYTAGFDEDAFLRNNLVKDATLMKLLVFGEYSTHVSDDLKSRFTEIQWQLIRAARNYYALVCRRVNWKTVWEVVNREIPDIKPKIEHIIEVLEKENNAKTD